MAGNAAAVASRSCEHGSWRARRTSTVAGLGSWVAHTLASTAAMAWAVHGRVLTCSGVK